MEDDYLILTQSSTRKTVREMLSDTQVDYLPNDFLANPVVSWVLDFSDLKTQNEIFEIKRGEPQDHDYDYKRKLYTEDFLKVIFQKYLVHNVTFFYTSLFHIGRQIKTAQYSTVELNNALAEKNLFKTTELNSKLFHNTFLDLQLNESEKQQVITTCFKELIEFAINQNKIKLAVAEDLWALWLKEVGDFRQGLEKINAHINTLLENYDRQRYGEEPLQTEQLHNVFNAFSYSYKTSKLYFILGDEGITFKNIPEFPEELSEYISFNSTMAIFHTYSSRDKFSLLYDYTKIMFELISEKTKLAYKNEEHAYLQKIEKYFDKHYGETDPFEKYLSIGPADESLRINMNYSCYNNRVIYFHALQFLNALRNSIGISPDSYLSNTLHYSNDTVQYKLKYIEDVSEENIKLLGLWVDHLLKYEGINLFFAPGFTAKEMIQEIFENRVVYYVFYYATQQIRIHEEKRWTLEKLADMFTRIILYLNLNGYNIVKIELERYSALWQKLMTGSSLAKW